MNGTEVVAIYEALLAVTERMLETARAADWAQLVALENECRRLIANLIAAEPHAPLSGALRSRKVELIRQVLARDAEITNVVDPWMKQLQAILTSASHEKQLQRAYAPD